MSLIFDSFPNMERAQAFATAVKERYGLDGQVFSDPDKAAEHDWFPWVQVPPIVHIDRIDYEILPHGQTGPDQIAAVKQRFGLTDQECKAEGDNPADCMTRCAAEQRVEDFVKDFGGIFIGT